MDCAKVLHSTFFLWLSSAVFGEVADESHHCYMYEGNDHGLFQCLECIYIYIYTYYIYNVYIYIYIHIMWRFSDYVCIVIESRMCDHILRYTCTIPRSEFPHLETWWSHRTWVCSEDCLLFWQGYTGLLIYIINDSWFSFTPLTIVLVWYIYIYVYILYIHILYIYIIYIYVYIIYICIASPFSPLATSATLKRSCPKSRARALSANAAMRSDSICWTSSRQNHGIQLDSTIKSGTWCSEISGAVGDIKGIQKGFYSELSPF